MNSIASFLKYKSNHFYLKKKKKKLTISEQKLNIFLHRALAQKEKPGGENF